MNQTNNRIREEWREKLNKILWDNIDSDVINCERPMKKQLAPDLENFIAELLKSQEHKLREELVEKVVGGLKDIPWANGNECENEKVICENEVLQLLSNLSPNKENE